jgi:hypothetical protein
MAWNSERQTLGCILAIAALVVVAIVVGRMLEGR